VALTGQEGAATAAIDEAFREVNRVEAMMTVYRDDSPVSEVNARAGHGGVEVPEELLKLVVEAKQISAQTDGKFDISFGALGGLWRYKAEKPTLPDPSLIEARLPLVDYRAILVDREKKTIALAKPGMAIGLGAIAKGYAVDRVAHILRSHGEDNFIINGGGDLFISGRKGDRPWKVGIQNPRDRASYFARFPVTRPGAVVTSGDYEKFFELDGKRYHHILDPDTGYPARGTVSVTILADSAARADALATGVFILGPEKGMELIEADDTLEGVIVTDELIPLVSSGLKDTIAMTPITVAKDR